VWMSPRRLSATKTWLLVAVWRRGEQWRGGMVGGVEVEETVTPDKDPYISLKRRLRARYLAELLKELRF
jgi:hypothetical protein